MIKHNWKYVGVDSYECVTCGLIKKDTYVYGDFYTSYHRDGVELETRPDCIKEQLTLNI